VINHAGSGRDGKFIYDEVYVYSPASGVEDIAIASDIADPLGGDSMPNARLIASAPDLLKELENCLDLLVTCFSEAPADSCIGVAITKARAAIKKATEGTP
jgi:hypothetical protein